MRNWQEMHELNEELKREIEVLRKYLSAASQRSDCLDEELSRSNIVLYNFPPINTAANTLKEDS